MILFPNEVKARDQCFGTSANAIAEFVKRYSVLLDGGAFVGSGVMVSGSSEYVYILTAKHNLTVRGKQDSLGVPDWTDEGGISALHKSFLDKVKIRADAFNVTVAISNIMYFGKDWEYDVCCLATSDPGLRNLWPNTANKLEELLWRGPDYKRDTMLGALTKNRQTELERDYFFVQTGFGCNRYKTTVRTQTQDDVDPDVRGTFNHRHLKVTNYWDQGHDYDPDEKVAKAQDCMAAAGATPTATSAPGDSGGGVFAMERKKPPYWILAGVNLGANMHQDANNRIQQEKSVVNNVFTVLDDRVLNPDEAATYTVVNGHIVAAKDDPAFAGFFEGREAVSVGQESEVEPEPVTSG